MITLATCGRRSKPSFALSGTLRLPIEGANATGPGSNPVGDDGSGGPVGAEQVGHRGRTVIAYGTPVVEGPDRIGTVGGLGLDEVLFARTGPWRTQAWSTSIHDVEALLLLKT